MKQSIIIIVVSLLAVSTNSFSQGTDGVLIDPNNATTRDASAVFQAQSTSQGVLVSRVTAAQRAAIATPATGLIVYQTDATAGFYYYNGTVWVLIANTTSNLAGVTAGTGLTGGGTSGTITVNAVGDNGLTTNADDIDLGGPLTQAVTTITQDGSETFTIVNTGTGNTTINLTSTGDFDVQDNGTSALFVRDDAFVGVGTNAPGTRLHVVQNAATMNLEGADHSYIQWYPDGFAAGRKAYTGYPSGLVNDFTIANEISGGKVALTTTSGNIIANSLAGTGNRFVVADASGNLTATSPTTAGVVTGAGTLNYIPKWTPNGSTLGNSLITDDATTITAGGQFDVTGGTGTSYITAPIEIRTSAIAPRLAFHYSGVVASQIAIENSGTIAIRDNPGTGYENFIARDILANRNIYNQGILYHRTSAGQGSGAHGISWYDPSFVTWYDYMAPPGTTNAPSGTAAPQDATTGVTSWARRFNMENVATYGWLFESGPNTAGVAPTVKFAINASNGNFHTIGNGVIDGTLKIAGGSPGAGKLLVSDAAGLASWVAPSSISVAYANLTGIPTRTAWSGVHRGFVAEQLSWKNYGNSHTIFDASAGTSPDGGAVNNTNAQVAWAASYPTLMGWNGTNTYGVRVDVARYAESAPGDNLGNHTATTNLAMAGFNVNGVSAMNGNSDNIQFMNNKTDDNTYEWLGYYSGGTRQGIILYDGQWTGANNLTNEFSITAENNNLLTLNTSGNSHIALMPKGTGNVGVGIITPAQKLDVAGKTRIRRGVNTMGANANEGQLEIANTGSGDAYISFHREGVWGAQFGLESDNWFTTKGWSPGAGAWNSLRVGNLDIRGVVNCIGGYCPSNNAVRLTPNLHLNSNAGNAVILNWDNGTTGATQTLRVGNGASADVFYVYADGQTFTTNWFRPLGSSGLYFQDYGGGWHMTDGTWIRSYNSKNVYINTVMRADGGVYAADNVRMRSAGNNEYGSTQSFSSYGLTLEQGISESGGFHADGDETDIWSPGDGNLLNVWDEDGMILEAYLNATGAYVNASDINKKQNITKVDNALAKVLSLSGYNYEFKLHPDEIAKGQTPSMSAGVIAQEVKEVMPELVSEVEGQGLFMIYDGLLPYLIEAIKEQQSEIEQMKDRTTTASDFGNEIMSGTEKWVDFSEEFITKNTTGVNPIVTVTPFGQDVNLRITETTSTGFRVVSNKEISEVSFNWIAMIKINRMRTVQRDVESELLKREKVDEMNLKLAKHFKDHQEKTSVEAQEKMEVSKKEMELPADFERPENSGKHDAKANDANGLIKESEKQVKLSAPVYSPNNDNIPNK